MDTNYQKMNLFDTSAVFVAVIGMLLIGLIIFLFFPEKQQKNIASAFRILDMSQEVEQQQKNLLAVFEATDDFSNSFYQAFVQVAAMPDEFLGLQNQIKLTFEKLGEYSEYITNDNRQQTFIGQVNAQRGEILGAFIDNSISVIKQQSKNDIEKKVKETDRQGNQSAYVFTPPSEKSLREYLPNLLVNY